MQLSDFSSDIEAFKKDELITDVIGELKSGKEATVYLVRRDEQRFALKHYRTMFGRGFASEATYREGRFLKARDARAFRKRSRYGRTVGQQTWIAQEFHMLRRLHRRGVPLPAPLAMRGASVLMEFIAERPGLDRPAPRLIDVELTDEEARRFHGLLMRAVITMVQQNVIHADLSPYNVLVPEAPADAGHGEVAGATVRHPVIIDFPQSVDPRFNNAAFDLLTRDISTMTSHLRGYSDRVDDRDLALRLWRQFTEGRL